MSKLPKVIGIIYPLSENLIKSFFDRDKNIFVKFTAYEPTRKTKIRIRKGIKLYAYQSRSKRIVVGNATIAGLEYLYLKEILSIYRNRLIIPEKELKKYALGREGKRLLVLHLRDSKRYKIPIKMKKPITMAGQYITLDNRNKLFE